MSLETQDWLDNFTLIGFAQERGNAWHYRMGTNNHFDYEVPMERVKELFNWTPSEVPIGDMITELIDAIPAGDARNDLVSRFGHLMWDGRKAIAHPNNGDVFGVFKDSYKSHDYDEWLVGNVQTLLDDTLRIGSAGLLKKGAVAWVQIEMPENIVTPEGESFRPSLLATTSLDGSLSTTYKRVITRVVCDNTQSAALGENGATVKIRHSKKSMDKIQGVREALGIVYAMADDFQRQIAEMCQTTVTDKQWSTFIEEFVPIKPDAKANSVTVAESKREKLTEMWNNDERVSPWRNTLWGAHQAVNTYTQHGTRTNKGTVRAEKNMMSTLNGAIDKIDAEAMTLMNNILANA